MALRRAVLLVLGTVLTLGGCGEGTGETPEATETVTQTVTASPEPTPTETAPTSESATGTATATPAPTDASSPAATTAPPLPPAPSGAVPRSYAEALAKFDAAGQEPLSYRRFATGDGAIFCLLSDKALRPGCEVDPGVQDPEACAGAPTQVVGRVELTASRARAVCNTDTIRSDMPDVLGLGEVAQSGDVQCISEKRGVTCISITSDAGFFLGRGRYVLLA